MGALDGCKPEVVAAARARAAADVQRALDLRAATAAAPEWADTEDASGRPRVEPRLLEHLERSSGANNT